MQWRGPPRAGEGGRVSDAVEITAGLVRRMIAEQFPRWAGLPVWPVPVDGWDNRTFRLGDDLLVRLPSAQGYAVQVEKEQRWLPLLRPLLPLPVPEPVGLGRPAEGYPWSWSVYRWIPGDTADRVPVARDAAFGGALGEFLAVLHGLDLGGPRAGAHSFWRGGPLTTYDEETRRSAAVLDRPRERQAALGTWEAALAAPWRGRDGWIHGDVAAGNLLVVAGALSGVIDFGCSAVGDPACDLTIAWTLLDGAGREAFRDAVGLDEGTWARARGWAVWKALITIEQASGGEAVDRARRTVHRVLAEHTGQVG